VIRARELQRTRRAATRIILYKTTGRKIYMREAITNVRITHYIYNITIRNQLATRKLMGHACLNIHRRTHTAKTKRAAGKYAGTTTLYNDISSPSRYQTLQSRSACAGSRNAPAMRSSAEGAKPVSQLRSTTAPLAAHLRHMSHWRSQCITLATKRMEQWCATSRGAAASSPRGCMTAWGCRRTDWRCAATDRG